MAPNIATRERYLAGSDETRVAALNAFLASPDIDAVLFSRGGYGAMRLLQRLDYAAMAARPRPLIGYSDVTALHQAFAVRSGVSSFHGPMLNTDFFEGLSRENLGWFLDALAGEENLTHPFEPTQVLAGGRAEGILFGGCLSLIVSLMGTPFDFWIDDGIWFWEDVSEPTYRIDRMLTHLKLSGRLNSIRGILVGRLKDCGGPDDSALDDLLHDAFVPLGIPVVRDLPFGHHGNNLLLPIGARAILDTEALSLRFPDALVEVRG